jgi:hypothetical protein
MARDGAKVLCGDPTCPGVLAIPSTTTLWLVPGLVERRDRAGQAHDPPCFGVARSVSKRRAHGPLRPRARRANISVDAAVPRASYGRPETDVTELVEAWVECTRCGKISTLRPRDLLSAAVLRSP